MRKKWAELSPETKLARLAQVAEYRKTLTSEDRDRWLAKARITSKKRRKARSAEKRAADLAYYSKWRDSRSADKLVADKEKLKLYHRERYKNRTPEQKQLALDTQRLWRANRSAAQLEKVKQYRKQRNLNLSPEKKAKAAEELKKRRLIPENRFRDLIAGAKCRAKKNGLSFDSDLEAFLLRDGLPSACLCCGVGLEYIGGKGHNPTGPSLDKVMNSAGYTKINTRVICDYCNRLKRDGSAQDHRLIAEYMDRESGVGLVEISSPPENRGDSFVLRTVLAVPSKAFVKSS